jgi:type II secretory pathway pseudopilin PulG
MREQSGRSLIEIISVLAIGGFMIAASYGVYNSISAKQKRLIASEELKTIATNTQTLLQYSGYQNVSVDFLIESGAIKNDHAPIGGTDWSVTSNFDGTEFSINLVDLTFDECAYFTTKKFEWTTHVKVNGFDSSDASLCMKTGENTISFYAQ